MAGGSGWCLRVLVWCGLLGTWALWVWGAASSSPSADHLVVRSRSLSARFDPSGDLRALSLLERGKPAWHLPLPATGSFWLALVNGSEVSPHTARLVSLRKLRDARGSALETVHEHAASHLRIALTYRIDASEPSLLKTTYRLAGSSATRRVFRFYVNTIGDLKATARCWVAYPYRSGQLIRADTVRDGDRPAPGHMWMQFMGYYDNEGHGLLSYPRDTTGYLKYATLLSRDGVTLTWSDVVVLPANGEYQIPFAYVLQPMRAPDTFNDICHAYARWARRQKWMTTVGEKIRQRPSLERLVDGGIVKDVCWGDLSRSRDGTPIPRGTFIPREQKERIIDDPAQFDTILSHARSLESLYSVKPVYRLDGWWGRFDSGYPWVLPVSPRLGGDERLKWFLKENEREGRIVVLHTNPVQYDTENERYDRSQIAINEDGSPVNLSVWSGNRLALASPGLATAPNLEVLRTLRTWGARGMWWDVLGAMSPSVDFSPSAHYPYYGRDSFQQSALGLFVALRRAAPDMIFGTEDGQEQMLPYFDYAPAYALGPESETVTWAPLNELVYGDAFIQAAGIEGNSRLYENAWRVTSQFYGAILGGDGRQEWTCRYTPVIQAVFEVNMVMGAVATQQMRRHVIDPRGWRASCWPGAVVIGNTDSDEPLDVSLDTPLGKVTVQRIRRYGFATLTDQGHWVCWGAHRLSLNGKVVVATSTPQMIAINNARRLTLFRYLYREPTPADLEPEAQGTWHLSCPALAERILSQGLVSIASGSAVALARTDRGALQFSAPPLTDAYRVAWAKGQ